MGRLRAKNERTLARLQRRRIIGNVIRTTAENYDPAGYYSMEDDVAIQLERIFSIRLKNNEYSNMAIQDAEKKD